MKRKWMVLMLAAVTMTSRAGAQTASPLQKPVEDQLARFFIPPELVLQHIQELGLQPGQRTTIVNAVKEAQGDMFDLQLQMADRSQELMKLLGGSGPLIVVDGRVVSSDRPSSSERLDETAVLAQVDRILAVERDMKRRQMQLLIRIRNALTKEQLEQMFRYRDNPGSSRPEGERF